MSAVPDSRLVLSEDDPRSIEELEVLAVSNLQNIIYQADEKDFVKANHRIWHNASYPSALKVRILPAS